MLNPLYLFQINYHPGFTYNPLLNPIISSMWPDCLLTSIVHFQPN